LVWNSVDIRSLTTGSASHKTVTQDVSRILWYYYNDSVSILPLSPLLLSTPLLPTLYTQTDPQRTLFVFCFANEAFFVCLYLAAYWVSPIAPHLPLPDFFLSSDLAKDHPVIFGHVVYALRHATWPQVVAVLTFPIMAGKQIINVVQFWKASKIVRFYLGVRISS
jgi:CDP-diacylglycerol--inositol 3-phosphatidyltransferase